VLAGQYPSALAITCWRPPTRGQEASHHAVATNVIVLASCATVLKKSSTQRETTMSNDNQCKVKSLLSAHFSAFVLVSERPRTESGEQADSPPLHYASTPHAEYGCRRTHSQPVASQPQRLQEPST